MISIFFEFLVLAISENFARSPDYGKICFKYPPSFSFFPGFVLACAKINHSSPLHYTRFA